MQTVSDDFQENSEKTVRNADGKVEIDWDGDSAYSNESHRLLSIEIERSVDEPLGGIWSAMADILLDNKDDRYTA